MKYIVDVNDPAYSVFFLKAGREVFDEVEEKGKYVSPGNLCSKVIDRCLRNRKKGLDDAFYWPFDFQEHRDRLREKERIEESNEGESQYAMAIATKLAAVPTLMDLLSDPARISELPRDAIAELRGQVAKIDTLLLSRLLTGDRPELGMDGDRLLTAREAAQKLGATEDWLYPHANTLPFVVRLGKKHLRFSAAGMERYIRQRTGR
jgi:predicted DNA-binding transcriptional regulator AlpA